VRSHPDTVPVRKGRVWLRMTDDPPTLFDERTGRSFSLTPVAHTVWGLCEGRTTLEEMVDEIRSEFELPLVDAQAAVDRALADLDRRHLIMWWASRARYEAAS
jgi:Coenzyme PQQ synthesis protein D (PqqD)